MPSEKECSEKKLLEQTVEKAVTSNKKNYTPISVGERRNRNFSLPYVLHKLIETKIYKKI